MSHKAKIIYDKLNYEVSNIIKASNNIKISHESSKSIQKQLVKSLNLFKEDLIKKSNELGNCSEWDKYTISFFGETNAGKSTIIEALRILGGEKSKIIEYEEIQLLRDEITECEQEISTIGINNLKSHEKLKCLEDDLKECNVKLVLLADNLRHLNNELNKIAKEILDLTKLNNNEINKKSSLTENRQSVDKNVLLINNKIKKEQFRIERIEKSLFFRIRCFFKKSTAVNTDKLIQTLNDKEILFVKLRLISSDLSIVEAEIKYNSIGLKTLKNDRDQNLDSIKKNEKIQTDFNNQIVSIESESSHIKALIKEGEDKNLCLESTISDKKSILKTKGDGKIIGTGVQDFTVDVNEYEFDFDGLPVVLIDVPGIEGNEYKYTSMIKTALLKSHAVFYVNGANKKPEEATLKKIKQYLQDQTEVFSIMNVKGKADTYEFDEDRVALEETHKDLKKTESLTKETLSNILGDKYGSHINTQGLIAFSALSEFINIGRKDLIKAQKRFKESFENSSRMRIYSNIDVIKRTIVEQQPYYLDKIRIANIQKVIGVVDEFVSSLTLHKEETLSDKIIRQIELEINNYNREVNTDVNNLKNDFNSYSEGSADSIVRVLREFIHYIIDKRYQDAYEMFPDKTYQISNMSEELSINVNESLINEFVAIFSEQVFKHFQKDFANKMNNETSQFFALLEKKKKRIKTRIDKINGLSADGVIDSNTIKLDVMFEGFEIGNILKEGFNVASTIGGMSLTGFALGSIIPIVGNIAGAIIGAIVGAVFYGIKKFFGGESKESKIKKKIEPELKDILSKTKQQFSVINNNSYLEINKIVKREKKILETSILDLKKLQKMLVEKIENSMLILKDINKEKKSLEIKIKR